MFHTILFSFVCILRSKVSSLSWKQSGLSTFDFDAFDVITFYNNASNELRVVQNADDGYSMHTAIISFSQLISNLSIPPFMLTSSGFHPFISYYAFGTRPYVIVSDTINVYDGYFPNHLYTLTSNGDIDISTNPHPRYGISGCHWKTLAERNSVCILYDGIDTIMRFGSALNDYRGCINGLTYNITSNEWTLVSWQIPVERYGISCSFDINHDNIYFFGGEFNNKTQTNLIHKWDYTKHENTDEEWSTTSDTLAHERSYADVVVHSTNVFVLFGGYTNGREHIQQIEIFNGNTEQMMIALQDPIIDPPLINVYKYGTFFINDFLFIYGGIYLNGSISTTIQYFNVSSIFDLSETDSFEDTYFCETWKNPIYDAVDEYLFANHSFLLFDILDVSWTETIYIRFGGFNHFGNFAVSPEIEISHFGDFAQISISFNGYFLSDVRLMSEYSSSTERASYWLSWGENEDAYLGLGPYLYENELSSLGFSSTSGSSLHGLDMEWIDIEYNGTIVMHTYDCVAAVTLLVFSNDSNISDIYFNVGDYLQIDWDLIHADVLSIPIHIYSDDIFNLDYFMHFAHDECLLCDAKDASDCMDCDDGIYIHDLSTYDIHYNNYSVVITSNSSVLNLRTDYAQNIYYFQRNIVDLYIGIVIDNNNERFSFTSLSKLYFTPIFSDIYIQPNATVFIQFDASFNLSNYFMFIDFDSMECELYPQNNRSHLYAQSCSDAIQIPQFFAFKDKIENQYKIQMYSDDVMLARNQSILSRKIQQIDISVSDTFYLGRAINISWDYDTAHIYQPSSLIFIECDALNIHYAMELKLSSTEEECLLTDLSKNNRVSCIDGISFQAAISNETQFLISFDSLDTVLSNYNISITRSVCPIGFGLVNLGSFALCDECAAGSVSVSSLSSECISDCGAIEGVQCLGFDDLILEYNYWIDINLKGTIITSACPTSYCCQLLDGCNFLDDSAKLCQLNRAGVLCGSCIADYSEVFGSLGCEKCDTDHYYYLLYPFCIAFIGIFILIISDSGSLSNPASSTALKKQQEWDYFKLLVQNDLECAKVSYLRSLMYFYQSVEQITVQTGFIFYIYPLSRLLSLDFLFVFDNDNESSDGICFISNLTALSKQLWPLFFPLSMFIAMILFRIFGMIATRLWNKKFLLKLLFGYGVLWNVSLIIMGQILTKVFILLSCRNIAGKSVHFYFGDHECHGTVWWVALVSFLFVIAFWVFIFFKLYTMTPKQRQSTHSHLRQITKPYKNAYWYWEPLVLTSRRMIFALMVCFQYISNSIFQFMLLIILVIYLIFHVKLYPFHHTRTNRLETLCLLSLIIATASINYIDYKTYLIASSIVMSLVALIPFLLFLYHCIISINNFILWKSTQDPYSGNDMKQRIQTILERAGIDPDIMDNNAQQQRNDLNDKLSNMEQQIDNHHNMGIKDDLQTKTEIELPATQTKTEKVVGDDIETLCRPTSYEEESVSDTIEHDGANLDQTDLRLEIRNKVLTRFSTKYQE